jgi:hypothetical protein
VKARAEPREGRHIWRFRRLARELSLHLIVGYDELVDDQGDECVIYNTAELIGPEGDTRGVYHKTHVLSGRDPSRICSGEFIARLQGRYWECRNIDLHRPHISGSLAHADIRGCARRWPFPPRGYYGAKNDCRLRTYAMDHGVWAVFAHPQRGLVVDPSGDIVAASSQPGGGHRCGGRGGSEAGPDPTPAIGYVPMKAWGSAGASISRTHSRVVGTTSC